MALLVLLFVTGLLGLPACDFAEPSQVTATSVGDLLAKRDQFVGATVSLSARVHVEPYWSAEPCTGDPAVCDRPFKATLHAVEPGQPRTEATQIDLYRPAGPGEYTPYGCQVLAKDRFDCGSFEPGAVTTITGTFTLIREPVQTVTSGGVTQVISYRDHYVLVVS
jgi:hypothetical protein